MKKNHNAIIRLWRDARGVSSIEYVLLLAFVGAGIVAGAGLLSEAIRKELVDVATCIADSDPDAAICK